MQQELISYSKIFLNQYTMYKKIIFIALALISIVGCRKDESNVQNPNQLNSTDYPTTLGGLESFLVPGYSNFRNANLYGYEYLPLVLSCDHSFCSQNSGGNPFGQQGGDFLTNNITVNNTPNAALYSQLYQGVAAMNVFLNRADYYQGHFGDAADVNALRGQAYFLRAYYFYLLESFYGEQYIDMKQPEDPNILGVPMPITFATNVAQTNLPRSSAYQVWSQIIKDLDSANSKLAGPPVADLTGKGYVTLAAAQAMLGKVYVFTKQYDSAKTYLLKVINNPSYSLPSYSVYSNSFNGNIANKFNSESLFEINVDQQADQAGILFSNPNQSLTTNASELWAPTIIGSAGVDTSGNGDGNGGTSTNMGNGYCKFFVHDQSLRRFGFTLPIYSYMHNPKSISSANTAASPLFVMDTASFNQSVAMRANQTVDPRLFVSALEPWVDSCEQPYIVSQYPSSQAAQFPDTIPVGKAAIINTTRADFWGWSFKKYATTTNAIVAFGGNDAANLILLRLADVYLLYAEACANTGDNTDALIYINKVNTRAYGGSTAHNYASLTSPTLANGVNDELASDPLKYERYVELFGEGGWWFDVCRWGIGAQEASYYVYGTSEYNPVYGNPSAGSGPTITPGVWSGSGTQIQAEHFPIPSAEMATNTAIQRNNYPYSH
jgi:hypothetical protein